MPVVDAEVEIRLICDGCKSTLDSSEQKRHGEWEITVTPCQDCLDQARLDGRESKEE